MAFGDEVQLVLFGLELDIAVWGIGLCAPTCAGVLAGRGDALGVADVAGTAGAFGLELEVVTWELGLCAPTCAGVLVGRDVALGVADVVGIVAILVIHPKAYAILFTT